MTHHHSAEPRWRTAKSCAAGNCVRVAFHGGQFLVGDSKNPSGTHLSFDGDEWRTFLMGAKNGDFDDLGA